METKNEDLTLLLPEREHMNDPPELLGDRAEPLKKEEPIAVIAKDVPPLDPTVINMMQRPRKVRSQLSHPPRIPRNPRET